MGKFVKLIGSGNDVQWSFDEEKIADEEQLDGCYGSYPNYMLASHIIAVLHTFWVLSCRKPVLSRMKLPFNG